MNIRFQLRRPAGAAALVAALLGCAPTLDWRTVDLPDTELLAELPCRPGRFEREVTVAAQPLRLFMLSCEAGGVTYGVATAETGDPTRVDAVLASLYADARAAVHASSPRPDASLPAGITPFSGNVSARLDGRRPDGRPVEQSLQLFARGTRVYEASALADHLDDNAVDPFRRGLRFALDKRVADPR